jgi:glycosyltransferase involved in cell wall biosynthesis
VTPEDGSGSVRILHLITSLTTGGAEAMLQKLVRAIRPLGYDSTVVSLTGTSTIGRELQEDGFSVVSLDGRGAILFPRQLFLLARTFNRLRPHVVHCWMYHSNVLGHAVVRLRSRRQRPGLVVSVRIALDAEYERKRSRNAIRRLDARLSALADAVVFNSHRAAEQHELLGYCMQRAGVIPNFFDTDYFKERSEEAIRLRKSIACEDGAVLIGLVARFDRQKDHLTFLRAARTVAAREPRCRFLLAGRGSDKNNCQLMHWVQECGLGDRVYALGERRDMPAVQSALDIAVSSSITEGFPNSVGEAMACGVPCVVTDVGDCKFVVGDGGVAVPPQDPEALAGAIIRLVDLPREERKRIGERGRRRVIAEFGVAPVVAKFTRLYEEVRDRAVAKASAD